MANSLPRLSPVWEHSLTNLLGSDPTNDAGRSLRQLVAYQRVHTLLDLLSWDPEETKSDPSQTLYDKNHKGEQIHHSPNQIKHLSGLITYMGIYFIPITLALLFLRIHSIHFLLIIRPHVQLNTYRHI